MGRAGLRGILAIDSFDGSDGGDTSDFVRHSGGECDFDFDGGDDEGQN